MRFLKKISILFLCVAILQPTAVFAASAKTEFRFNKLNVTLNKGNVTSITAIYTAGKTKKQIPANKVIWSSSNTKVAKIKAGKITAVAPGNAVVKGKYNGKTASCKVVVKSPIQKVTISKESVTIEKGKTYRLTSDYTPKDTTDSKRATWTSSNTRIATVSSNGTVTGKSQGSAFITVKMGRKTARCKVTVKNKQVLTMKYDGKYINVSTTYSEMNKLRKSAKVPALIIDKDLEFYAKIRAQEIVTRQSHRRPNGLAATSIIPETYIKKAENLAYGSFTATSVVSAWNKSPDHKKIMLDKGYKRVGVACFTYKYRNYWIALFTG